MKRYISLLDNIDTDKIEAKYQNEATHLHMTKSETHRAQEN